MAIKENGNITKMKEFNQAKDITYIIALSDRTFKITIIKIV